VRGIELPRQAGHRYAPGFSGRNSAD
jgi:hypothetical protein